LDVADSPEVPPAAAVARLDGSIEKRNAGLRPGL
jgi:hypothetical protein